MKAGEFRALPSEGNVVGVIEVSSKSTGNMLVEAYRKAAASGVSRLKEFRNPKIVLDCAYAGQAVAEGAYLSQYAYDKFIKKDAEEVEVVPEFKCLQKEYEGEFNKGKTIAECQNWARHLADTPANLKPPQQFVKIVEEKFKEVPQVKVVVRDENWIKNEKMNLFYSVAVGSDQPPRLLELHYKPQNAKNAEPIVLVGKGVTFDAGGISLKPSANMGLMKGDMGGAASVISTLLAIAKLNVPVNIVVLTPLTENLPSGKATKPGDLFVGRNGVSVEVDNTDAEGRMILADTLDYAHSFNPKLIIDVATLTGAMDVALGPLYSGVFCNDDELFSHLHKAGEETFDRVWRMPLDDQYKELMKTNVADMKNSGGRSGGSCTAAIFLKQFIKDKQKWAHIDMAGVMDVSGPSGYYKQKGMTGRPTRMLVSFIEDQSK
ncbi:leucine aminopeptidase-like protein 3 [Rozella allomycis CSF55]|uniref:leucyl aminopeptidase n=1 Tax=Rozella allomycis (strain CSF55) TaxID=988480 RepID=A0A4P9YHT9_ROZAC|nr:leucine aminopeptidase-like protein 3 [Rozella allomycis CSF55]